jgi:hypothetical protein
MMCILNVRHVACIALVMGFAHAAAAADILIADAKSQPESLTAVQGGCTDRWQRQHAIRL